MTLKFYLFSSMTAFDEVNFAAVSRQRSGFIVKVQISKKIFRNFTLDYSYQESNHKSLGILRVV